LISSADEGGLMKAKHLVLCAVVLAASAAAFAFDVDDLSYITIENETGVDIDYIFLSPGDSEYWGPELLGADYYLEKDDSIGYYLFHPNTEDRFDILAIDKYGNAYQMLNYSLYDGAEIVLSNKNRISSAPELEYVTVTIRNDVMPIEYLFMSPSDSDMWGADFLDDSTILESDDSISYVFPVNDDGIKYDLMAIDDEGDSYSFSFTVDSESDGAVWAIEWDDIDV
jgi:hypothetical protein